MVCKEEVVEWFRSLKSHNRIDVMCTLLDLCVPLELRFLGTCLENLGKRDFYLIRNSENEANNLSDINSKVQCISDKQSRPNLGVYLSLLNSCNYTCCNGLYKILGDVEEVNELLKSPSILEPDDTTLEDLLLIYTLAIKHPAFTFNQKLVLGDIFKKLQDHENNRSSLNQPRANHFSAGDSANDKLSPQGFQINDQHQHIHNTGVTNTSHCQPLSTTIIANHVTGEPFINHHDPLSAGYHLRYANFHHSQSILPSHIANTWPLHMLPQEPTTSPSLINSRTSSPCQSNSPSRAGSPGRPKPPLTGPYPRPPPADPLREMLGKEMPNYYQHLKDYNEDQLRQMSEDELRDLGLTNGAIYQLRSIVNKTPATNGISNVIDGSSNNNNNNKKRFDNCESEVPAMRRYPNIFEASATYFAMTPQIYHYPTSINCFNCQQNVPHTHNKNPVFCITDQMKGLNFEPENSNSNHCSTSSASDSASDHSPPDTPSLSNTSDRVPVVKEQEVWLGSDDREQRIGNNVDNVDDRRHNNAHPNNQSRLRGIGRSRSTPPGIQSLTRGRVIHPSTQRRRDMSSNSVNGAPDDRKVFGPNEIQPFPFNPGAPFIPPPQYIRAPHYPTYPTSYVGRPTFPFHHPNGEVLYQYPPSQTTFLQPTQAPQATPISYPTIVPQPKISCYNCGSQNHLPSECQESTFEEVSKQGQYRIDFTPKSGENSTNSSGDK